MMPRPWSHTALEDFVNCPRSFFEKRVAKSVREAETEQQLWGTYVHEAFERRLRDGRSLPDELEGHEPFMQKLEELRGQQAFERKIALNRSAEPCDFFGNRVWFRGVIDHELIDGDYALLTDYKTGKQHQKFGQLKLFALWCFAAYPALRAMDAQYYWTQSMTTTRERYTREMVPLLWKAFIPSLRQYAEAFKTETFTPRPSGLCNGWCPVTSCEFWKPKRAR